MVRREARHEHELEGLPPSAVAGYRALATRKDWRWYLRAAKRGDAVAQFTLAKCYRRGMTLPADVCVVARDGSEAVYWCREAARQVYHPPPRVYASPLCLNYHCSTYTVLPLIPEPSPFSWRARATPTRSTRWDASRRSSNYRWLQSSVRLISLNMINCSI